MYENIVRSPSGVTGLTPYCWCEQIASGMEYLAQKQIIHGDLAARKVLVFKDDVVKISDFGLSKQLYGCTTYQMKKLRKLPWKWSSIELLKSLEISEMSDVWAFGVTAWEILSLGQTPYKGMMFGDEFIQFLQAGKRLPKPAHASEEMFCSSAGILRGAAGRISESSKKSLLNSWLRLTKCGSPNLESIQ